MGSGNTGLNGGGARRDHRRGHERRGLGGVLAHSSAVAPFVTTPQFDVDYEPHLLPVIYSPWPSAWTLQCATHCR
jgi:hypothetical protein